MENIIMYPGDTTKEAVDWKAVQGQHVTAVQRNILVLGSGGREHALAWKLAQSEGAHVFIAPGNAGTAEVGSNVNIKVGEYIIQCFRLIGGQDLKVGDIITVTGLLKNYKGTVEFDSKCTYTK